MIKILQSLTINKEALHRVLVRNLRSTGRETDATHDLSMGPE